MLILSKEDTSTTSHPLLFVCCQTNHRDPGTACSAINTITRIQVSQRVELYKAPSGAVIHFLKWYRKNHTDDLQRNLVNNADANTDTTKPYSVNFKDTERYLSDLKSSGFLSEKFLNKWRNYFRECDDYFKQHPQYDGPPDGFNYDLILNTQDVEESLIAIDTIKIVELHISGNNATVEVDLLMRVLFRLSQSDSKWLIDEIEIHNAM